MLYKILKVWVRLAMFIFCRRLIINKRYFLKSSGPLLLACNHPNSFLDAVILDVLFKHPIHPLTRGDVFKKPFYIKLLKALKMLPIYRMKEGVENLGINYETFDACKNIFKRNGIVLIFSEALCVNEWHLRVIRKGTARLAFSSWKENIPLQVLPMGINYSSFRRFGKNVFINFGEIISPNDFDLKEPDGKLNQAFTNKLQQQLQQLVFEIDKNDIQKQKHLLEKKPSVLEKIILFIPAIAGYIIHAPLYLPLKTFTYKRTWNNDHYDAVLIGLLVFTYPVYLLLITIAVFFFTKSAFSFLLLILLPFTAWAYVQVKKQLDK